MNETRLEIDDFPIPVGDDESVVDRVVWANAKGRAVLGSSPVNARPGGKWTVRGCTAQALMAYSDTVGHDCEPSPQTIGEALSSARGRGERGVLVFDETLTVVGVYRA